MSVDENVDRLSTAVNTSTPTSLIFSDNPEMVSLEAVRDSNLRARDLDNLVAVFGMLSSNQVVFAKCGKS